MENLYITPLIVNVIKEQQEYMKKMILKLGSILTKVYQQLKHWITYIGLRNKNTKSSQISNQEEDEESKSINTILENLDLTNEQEPNKELTKQDISERIREAIANSLNIPVEHIEINSIDKFDVNKLPQELIDKFNNMGDQIVRNFNEEDFKSFIDDSTDKILHDETINLEQELLYIYDVLEGYPTQYLVLEKLADLQKQGLLQSKG